MINTSETPMLLNDFVKSPLVKAVFHPTSWIILIYFFEKKKISSSMAETSVEFPPRVPVRGFQGLGEVASNRAGEARVPGWLWHFSDRKGLGPSLGWHAVHPGGCGPELAEIHTHRQDGVPGWRQFYLLPLGRGQQITCVWLSHHHWRHWER